MGPEKRFQRSRSRLILQLRIWFICTTVAGLIGVGLAYFTKSYLGSTTGLLVGIVLGLCFLEIAILVGVALGRLKNRGVSSAPGSRLHVLASFVFSKKTYERVYLQIILDMREEYNEALHAGRVWHARWIWVRGVLCFWLAAWVHIGVSILQLVKRIWVAAS